MPAEAWRHFHTYAYVGTSFSFTTVAERFLLQACICEGEVTLECVWFDVSYIEVSMERSGSTASHAVHPTTSKNTSRHRRQKDDQSQATSESSWQLSMSTRTTTSLTRRIQFTERSPLTATSLITNLLSLATELRKLVLQLIACPVSTSYITITTTHSE